MKKIHILFTLIFPLFLFCEETPDLTIIGTVDLASGIRRQPADLIEAFKDTLEISLRPTAKNNCTGLSPEAEYIANNTQNLPLGDVVLYEALLPIGVSKRCRDLALLRKNHPDRLYIAYSMFEATAIPEVWASTLNRFFDLVVVPDPFLVDVYKDSGVNIPIFVLPIGLNFQSLLQAPLHEKKNTPFVFGNLSTGIDRKNQPLLIKAFKKAFGNRKDVHLLINVRSCELDVKNQILEEIKNHRASNITFSEKNLSAEDYFSTLSSLDCYVSLSKSEGYSIQPREAMALGIPVIATNNSAQKTICDTGLVLSVETPIKQESYHESIKSYVGFNNTCSVEDATEALLTMYENYSHYLEIAEQARQWAATTDFSYLSPYYFSLLYPQEVVLGDENKITPDACITNSPLLYNKIAKLIEKKKGYSF